MIVQPVAWVTGASSGLGFHTAAALAGAGWRVAAGARSFQEGKPDDGNISYFYLDVTQSQSIQAFAQEAMARFGRVDALVGCAGILVMGACEEISLEQLQSVMQTNFIGMAAVIQAALPFMRRQGFGKILCFSSINGLLGIPFQGAYTASKHALEGYCECLAMEAAPLGIDVCLVEPGDHRSGSRTYRGVAHGADEASPYAARRERAIAAIRRDEANGSDPDRLGAQVVRLLARRRLPMRRVIAKGDQRLAVWLHKLLPARWFARILCLYYTGGR